MNSETKKAPDQLDQAMVVIDLKAWISIATVMLVLGAALIWGFFGTMRLKEDVSGVLIKSGRVINLYAPEDCILLDLSVSRRQSVERDQVVARIDQTELVNEINALIESGAPADEIEAAQKTLLRQSQIVCYESGVVQDVFVHAGDYVTKGTKIATVVQSPPKGKNLECFLYVPMEQIHNVKKGMQVSLYPDFADKNTYGNMMGTVASISTYPVTENYMFDVLGSQELAQGFMKNSACFEVAVSLVTSEETPTGYLWTTSKGPSSEIGNLSLCQASVVQGEVRPIDVFFLNKF